MSSKLKRFLSLLLAFTMVLSIVPVSAEGSDGAVVETATSEETLVAQIERTGEKYTSLDAAFKAAQDGDTIKLLDDVVDADPVKLSVSDTEVKTITLDLDGYTWDCGYGTRINAVNLTVKNGTIGDNRRNKETFDGEVDVFHFGGHAKLPSTMVVENVTLYAELHVNNMAPSDEELGLLQSTSRSTSRAFNATEVILKSKQYDVVTVQKGAYLTVNGGLFKGGINAEEGSFVTDNRKSETTDSGETVDITKAKIVTIMAPSDWNYIRTERGVTITFVDPTPVATRDYMQFTLGENSQNFTVQRYRGEDQWEYVGPVSGTSTIQWSFGEFGSETFRVDWDNNGTYDRLVVLVKAPVAKVGDKYYTNIDEALANWTDGTTLTVLADVTVNLGAAPTTLANDEVTLDGVTRNAADGESALSIESGDVTLIVNADSTLTGGKGGAGIYVAEGASVTITGAGKLTAIGNGGVDTSDSGAAGIGGTYANGNSGTIIIDGATVVAMGYGVHGSGIGSGSGKVVGEIKIINGANVTAYGGYYADGVGTTLQSSYGKSDPEGGAAIGGGGKTVSTIADITIADSTVIAFGGSKAAGIGANFWSGCGTITISGNSNVTAQGGSSSAGIGTSREGDNGVGANIVISGGTVNATGGAYGAGIGGGYNNGSLGNGADASALPEISVTISGGTITATGGEGGAGIGGGYKRDNIDIDITGGTVTAQAGALVSGKTIDNGGEACAIGSGANGSGVFENSPAVKIADTATVTATTEYGGKVAIEGYADEAWDASENVTVIVNGAPITGTITGAEGDDLVWSEEDGDSVGPLTIAGDVTITVIGKVPVVGTIRLSPDSIVNVKFVSGGEYNGNPATLIRDESFTGQMFYVEGASGDFQNLIFENITLDGGAVWTGDVDKTLNRGTTNSGVKATGSVLYLAYANADLKGSTLQNHDDSNGEKANAVFLRYYSTIDFNGSVVRNNNSVSSYYRGGVVTIRQGGTVTTNGTNVYGNSGAAGGFVGISTTGSYGGIVKAYDSDFHNNYADNGAVFLMQCNSKRGYLEIDGCEFYNNASKTAVLSEWAHSRPFIISNSYFHDNECAVWDCHADPVLDISGNIVVTEDADYSKYLFETPLALGGALADGSSISISEATMTKLMTNKGFVVTGTADYAVTEADQAKFVIPAGYKFWEMDYNSDGINDYALIVDTDEGVNVTVYDNFPDSDAYETQLLPTTDESLPAVHFVHEGFTFKGWMTTADGTETIKALEFEEETTLYALWTPEVPVVTLSRADAEEPYCNILLATVTNKFDNLTYTYQWYMNDVAIEGATSETYEITETATYKCEVTVSTDGFVPVTGSVSGSAEYKVRPVAQVGETIYGTLKDAVAAANAIEGGATVIMLANTELGEMLTISGNVTIEGEYTITRADTYTGTLFEVAAGATLTLDGGLTIDGGNHWTMDMETYNADLMGMVQVQEADYDKYFTLVDGEPVSTAHMITVNGGTVNLNAVTVQNEFGTTISNAGVVKSTAAGSVVTLTGATIKHIASVNSSGVVVHSHTGCNTTITINDGTVIDGNHVGGNHGLFLLYPAVMTMNGGEIKNTTGVNSNGVVVGVVTADSKFIMNGGTICSSSSVWGKDNQRNPAVYLHNSGEMLMTGGTICHNIGKEYGGGIGSYKATSILTITGGSVIENISLNNDNRAPAMERGDDVDSVGTVLISGGTYGHDVSKWCIPGYECVQKEDGLWVVQEKIYAVVEVEAMPGVWLTTEITEENWADLKAALGENTGLPVKVTLMSDIELGEMLTVAGNTEKIILGNGHTITRKNDYTGTLFTVSAGTTLTLDGGLTIDGGNAWTYIKMPLDLDMANGAGTTVTDHITPAEGGVNATANMIENKGTLNVNSVTIQNSYSTAGVHLINAGANSRTTINGATIKNTAANASGAVAYINGNDAVLTIKGDTRITGNFGIGNGGIIQNYGQGTTVNLEGGSIDNNHVGKSGTLYASYSGNASKINTFNMSGGIITNNIMEGYGPVYIHTNTVWNMTGGEISGNTSYLPNYVRNNNPAGTMSGGRIVDNVITDLDYSDGYYVTHPDLRLNGKTGIIGGTYTQDVTEYLAPYYGLAIDVREDGVTEYTVTDEIAQIEGSETIYHSIAEAIAEANDGDKIVVLVSHKVDATTVVDKNVTIDLNDKTVSGRYTTLDPMFRIHANVTIESPTNTGKIDARNGEAYVFIVGKTDGTTGTLTLKSGTFYGETTVASVTNGTLNVEGGLYAVNPYEGSYDYLLNCIDANYTAGSAKINVTGGTFYKFDPSNNAAEGEGTSFLADGYISEELTENYFTVRVANYVAQVGDVKYEELKEALEACTAGETVMLIADIVYEADDVVYAHGGGTGFGKYDAYNPSIVYIGGTKGETEAENQPSNVNAVIDLNGHSITNNASAYLFLIMDNAKVTFTGNGSVINNSGSHPAIWAVGAETLVTITSGNYVTNSPYGVVHVTHSADMTITGGSFSTTADDASLLVVLNSQNYNDPNYFLSGVATISISGGSFKGFNPELVGDDYGASTIEEIKFFNGCATGYEAVLNEENGWYTVQLWDYEIWNKEDLYFFAELANDGFKFEKTVQLMNDVDLEGETWTPIAKFGGVFAGKDHTISNFNIDATAGHGGFFNVLEWATVEDLTLADVTATVGAYRFGTLARSVNQTNIDNVTVSNVKVTTTVSSAFVAGLFCHGTVNSNKEVNNCTVEDFTVNAQNGAMLIAGITTFVQKNGTEAEGTNILENLHVKNFKVTINDTDGYAAVGGLVGQTQTVWQNPRFNNCSVTGLDVTASGNVDVGGFICYPGSWTYAENCSAAGKINVAGVTSASNYAGGFFGNYGWGDNVSKGDHKVTNCTANVEIITKIATAGGFVGSGTNSEGRNKNITLTNCKALGTVTCVEGGTAIIGGFAGLTDRGIYTNCTAAQEPFIGYVADETKLVNNNSYVAKVGDSLYATFDAALAAAKASEEKKVEILAPVVLTTDKEYDLADVTVTNKGDVYPLFRIQNGANVTVKGGTVTNNDYVFVLGASDGSSAGYLTIESGSYTGNTSVASVTKGQLNITGGTFAVNSESSTYLLNCIDANYAAGSAAIVVTGGTFYGFNPEENAAEGAETNFCELGYLATETIEGSDVWTVAEWDGKIYTKEELEYFRDLVDAGKTFEGKTVKLMADIDLEGDLFDPIGSYRKDLAFKGTFDGQGYSIKNLSQNTWALNNGYYYSDLGLGLFGLVEGATIKNLTINGADISGESAICGTVAACAYGACTFENITIKNANVADYQYYAGGIVGWASGNHQYIDCNVQASTTIAAQWGDFDNSTGGVIGGCGSSATILMKDCVVACRIDSYNDVTSSYRWYAYRRAGMLIGNTGKTANENGRTVAAAPQLTCEGVTVYYGAWADYHYCEFAGTNWPYVRVEAGISNSAYSNPRYGHPTDANGNTVVDDNHVHNEGEDCMILCKFDQLYGGGQGVYGQAAHAGVTVYQSVARIESTGNVYETLTAALAVAEETDTVTLLREVGEYTVAQAVTIDNNNRRNTNLLAGEGYKVEQAEDNDQLYIFSEIVYVAQVGETKYEDLKEAIEACTNGETVMLIADITYDADDVVNAIGGATGFGDYANPAIIDIGGERVDGVNYPSDVNAVIDLNGHTITNNADAYLFLIMDNARITFTGTGSVVSNAQAPVVWSTGTDTVVTINGGEYSSAYPSLMWATHSGDLVIKRGEFKTTADDASCLIMRNEKDRQNSKYFISGKSTVTVTGGTFYGFNPEHTLDDSKTPAFEFNAVADGYIAREISENVWTVVKGEYVAQITDADGNVIGKYETLAETVEAVQNGETIILLADSDVSFEVSGSIGLDVNGTNYTGTITLTDAAATLTAEEELNVTTNVENGAVIFEDGVYKVIVKFRFKAAQVVAGNSLDMMFAFSQNELKDWTGHYVQITREFGDGTAAEVTKVPYEDWETSGSVYYVTYTDLAAKEMSDQLTLVVCNAEGEEVSYPWIDSIRAYSMRMLQKATDDTDRTLFVDMLNYGAAAQMHFDYNTGDLANNQLSAEQKGYASAPKTMASGLDQGDKHVGSNLITKSNIQFWVAFKGLSTDMYAIVEYTSHHPYEKSIRIEGSEFGMLSGVYYLNIDELVCADARQVMTITIYNADGSVYTTCQESIEDYLARQSSLSDVYKKAMQFFDSCYAYLHK